MTGWLPKTLVQYKRVEYKSSYLQRIPKTVFHMQNTGMPFVASEFMIRRQPGNGRRDAFPFRAGSGGGCCLEGKQSPAGDPGVCSHISTFVLTAEPDQHRRRD